MKAIVCLSTACSCCGGFSVSLPSALCPGREGGLTMCVLLRLKICNLKSTTRHPLSRITRERLAAVLQQLAAAQGAEALRRRSGPCRAKVSE